MDINKNIWIWILLIIVGVTLLKYFGIIDFGNFFSIVNQGISSGSASSSLGGGVS